LSFEEECDLLFEKINKNKTQIHTLQSLRDTLLPKLMSGEVRVKFKEGVFWFPRSCVVTHIEQAYANEYKDFTESEE